MRGGSRRQDPLPDSRTACESQQALHEADVEPFSELAPDFALVADRLVAAAGVQGDRRGVIAHDPGDHRVEAVVAGELHEIVEQHLIGGRPVERLRMPDRPTTKGEAKP